MDGDGTQGARGAGPRLVRVRVGGTRPRHGGHQPEHREAERPAPRRTLRASARELRDALAGRAGGVPAAPAGRAGGAPTPPAAWLPGWLPGGLRSLVGTVTQRGTATLAWWRLTRVARAQRRFGTSQGGLLCGGLAYTALFSLFASLTIGYTIFMTVLGSRSDLRASLLDTIDDYVPGLLDTGHGGAIDPDQLLLTGVTSLAGLVAVLVLLWSAVSFMSSLRQSVRTMFGLQLVPQNLVVGKLRDLAAFLVLGAAVVASSTTSVLATRAASWAARNLGRGEGVRWLFTAGGLVAAAVVDALVVLYVVRVHAGARPRRADLLRGVAVAAVVFGALRFLGTAVIAGSASRNVLLASFAAVVTLLLLVNVLARVLLLVCAWMSDPHPDDLYPEVPARAAHRGLRRTVTDADDGRPGPPPQVRGRVRPSVR